MLPTALPWGSSDAAGGCGQEEAGVGEDPVHGRLWHLAPHTLRSGWPCARRLLTFLFSMAELAGVGHCPAGDTQGLSVAEPLTVPVCFSFLENVHLHPGTLLHLRGSRL